MSRLLGVISRPRSFHHSPVSSVVTSDSPRHANPSSLICDFDTILYPETNVSAAFMSFAAERFMVESVKFLQDVKAYKQYFFQRTDRWRISKFKTIVENYIEEGSDMELNLPSAIRKETMQVYASLGMDSSRSPNRKHRSMVDIAPSHRMIIQQLDEKLAPAYREIKHLIVENHLWEDFCHWYVTEYMVAQGDGGASVPNVPETDPNRRTIVLVTPLNQPHHVEENESDN